MQLAWLEPHSYYPTLDVEHLRHNGITYERLELDEHHFQPTLDTLDVAVVGAEWGEGKRSGWLTSFIIAVADEDGSLVEIGRVGTGFKELEREGGATFEEMTGLLREDIVGEEGKVVRVRPKVVLEVKFEEIQKSPSYGSGFALRFPRVVRIRADRRTDEVSALADVLDLYEAQRGRNK